MDLAQRKLVELGQKLESLQSEFKDWRDRSEAGKLLEKNHTQIRRVTAQLDGYRDQIHARLGAAAANPASALTACRDLELDILEVHRLWHFFRGKLATRLVERFQKYLYAADELAWACYEAAQRKVAPNHVPPDSNREPPLVFFNGGASPFAASRNLAYEAEPVPGASVRPEALVGVLKALPIPVIGIPWFQIEHLSDALVICHEVGHNVEDDFGLTPRLTALIVSAGLPDDHRDAWQAWRGEVFADVYGCLAMGPAFTSALVDFLANDPAALAGQMLGPGAWGSYPTDYLRVLLSVRLLRRQGFTREGDELENEWTAAIGTSHALPEFVQDFDAVLKVLVDGPYPEFQGAKLSDLLPFGTREQTAAAKLAERLLQGLKPDTLDVRQLFAGARLAYHKNPVAYLASKVPDLVLGNVPRKIAVRGSTRAKQQQEMPVIEGRDRLAGAQLFDTITALRRASQATP